MTKSYLKQGYAIIVALLLFSTSCGDLDLLDTDKWSDKIDAQPDFTLPLAYGHFTLWDLLMDTTNDYIQKEPLSPGSTDSMLVIKYTQHDIYTLSGLSDVFNMPEENFSFAVPAIPIPAELIGFQVGASDVILPVEVTAVTIDNIPADCDLKEIIAGATLQYSLPRLSFDYFVRITFDNIYKVEDGDNYAQEIPVNAGGGFVSNSITLANVRVDLPDADKQIKLNMEIRISAGETIQAGEISGLTLALNSFTFQKATGSVALAPIAIDGDFDMDIDFLNEIGGNFMFADPEVKLIVKNAGIGVSADLKLDLWVNSGTGNEKFIGTPLSLVGNKEKAMVEESVGYSGPQLADFLSLPPTGRINYQGAVAFNSVTDDNVIWSDGSISVDAVVRIPLKLSAKDLHYSDTINDLDLKDADKIVSAKITIVAENGIPLELEVKGLVLVKENNEHLSTIVANKPLAASSRSQIELTLSEQNITDLPQAKYILLDIGASTGEDGDQIVTISPNAVLNFKLIISAKTDLNKL